MPAGRSAKFPAIRQAGAAVEGLAWAMWLDSDPDTLNGVEVNWKWSDDGELADAAQR